MWGFAGGHQRPRPNQILQSRSAESRRGLFTGPILHLVDEAVTLRKKIEAMPVNTVEDVQTEERLLAEAEEKTARLRYAADLLLSVEFQPVSAAAKEELHNSMAIQAGHYVTHGTIEEFRAVAKKAMNGQPTFHWPLEFPEVMLDRGGFDAFVCNPPFMGGQKITGNLGDAYREFLVHHLRTVNAGALTCVRTSFCASQQLIRSGEDGPSGHKHHRPGRYTGMGLDQLFNSGCNSSCRAESEMAGNG